MGAQFAILDFSTPELVIILLIVLLLFGSKKLPELSRSVGESMRELRKTMNGNDHETRKKSDEKARDSAE